VRIIKRNNQHPIRANRTSVILTFSILLLLTSFAGIPCVALIIVYRQITRGVRGVIVAMFNLGLSFDGSLDGACTSILNSVVHFQ
jgi:hypothetical protein